MNTDKWSTTKGLTRVYILIRDDCPDVPAVGDTHIESVFTDHHLAILEQARLRRANRESDYDIEIHPVISRER